MRYTPATLKMRDNFRLSPPMVTVRINGGCKDKVRPGDVLSALTATKKLLSEGMIKGRKFRVRELK